MFVEVKTEPSRSVEYIDSSCLISMSIIDIDERNQRSAVKKYSAGNISHILEAKTTNNVLVNDRISVNGYSAYSFDSEAVNIHYGTENECLDRLETLQSSLNWLKSEVSNSVVPHGSYINPSGVMRLQMYERINTHLHKPNTHQIDCILNHRYISSIQDFIPPEYCTATGNLDHSLKQDCDTITILLKGAFRWRNEENSRLSLKQKSCLRHSVVKVHKQNCVGAITSANNSSRSGNSKLLKMWHLCLLPRISTPARRRSGSLNLSNLLVD